MPEFPRPNPTIRSLTDDVRLVWLTRRWPRFLVAFAMVAVATTPLVAAHADARRAAADWDGTEAWVTQAAVAAGDTIPLDAVARVRVPHHLIPADAVDTNPAGSRVRVSLAAREVIRSDRLAGTPDGSGGIELQVPTGHLTPGDLVDLYDLLSGVRVAASATVLALDAQNRPTIAVDGAEVGAVVRSLSNGEVVPVLVG